MRKGLSLYPLLSIVWSSITAQPIEASFSQGIWEKIWETLQKQFHIHPHASPVEDPHTQSVYQRRWALYQHTLKEHYRVAADGFHRNNRTTLSSVENDNHSHNDDNYTNTSSMDHEKLVHELYNTYLHQSRNRVKLIEESKEDNIRNIQSSWPIFPESLRQGNRDKIKEMFRHAYDSYMYHGWPLGEVRPVCNYIPLYLKTFICNRF
jgi:hypothetical protein